MALSKYLVERLDRNKRLALADAKRRCSFCKRALPRTGVITRWENAERFCNTECMADQDERKALR